MRTSGVDDDLAALVWARFDEALARRRPAAAPARAPFATGTRA
ncbi:hypothetical protein [Microbispora rosea]